MRNENKQGKEVNEKKTIPIKNFNDNYEKPIITFVKLKVEERLMVCAQVQNEDCSPENRIS